MPEASPTQSTLKRLIEAEEQAQEIVKAAEERARQAEEQAREQARQSIEAVRAESADLLRSLLTKAQSKADVELEQRMKQAEAKAREFEARAQENLSSAVELVVDWVTGGED